MSSAEDPAPSLEGHGHVRKRGRQQRRCPECGQNFTKTEHLERHIRTHTREKPFRCGICGKAYSRHDSLLRHDRTHQPTKRKRSKNTTDRENTSPQSSSEATFARHVSMGSIACDDAPQSQSPLQTRTETGSTVQEASNMMDHVCNSHSENAEPSRQPPYFLQDDMNFQDLPASIFNTPTDLDFRDLGIDFHEPMWLPASFDVSALNDSISTTILEWGNLNAATSYGFDQRYDGRELHLRTNGTRAPAPSASTMQQNRFTSIPSPETPLGSISTTTTSNQDRVDDQYREDLSHRLRPRVNDHSLPSADFLNLCIKLYFTKFNPVLPLIHAPSFRPSSDNALHLLSICSVGALFVGSASAEAQGRKIFQTLNKAILASSESYLNQGSREVLSIVQAATIGQTFGMLSGLQSDLLMTESYHGSIIAWARHGGFFKRKQSLGTVSLGDTSKLEQTWKDWVHAEESVRIVAGLQIHDAEFAIAFQHEPLLRHAQNKIPPCCADDLFAATTAEQWFACLGKTQRLNSFVNIDPSLQPAVSRPDHNRSHMVAYAALAGIFASIQEMRCSFLEASSIEYFRSSLLTWHHDYALAFPGERYDPANLMILWHKAFMALYADFNQLEGLTGRHGDLPPGRVRASITIWTNSSEARRSVLHALLIVKHLEALPVGAEIAIHVPRALFYSAIVIFNYIKTAATVNLNIPPSQEEMEIPEIQVSEPNDATVGENERASPTRLGSIDPSLLCHIIDLLRRIGHWEVSRRYAGVLEGLLNDFAKQ